MSGVSFPYLDAKMELSDIGYYKNAYKTRQKFQWLYPEDTLTIKTSPSKLEAIRIYLRDLFNPDIKKDLDYIWSDPLPTIARMVWTCMRFLI